MRIATYVNDDDNVVSFYEKGSLVLFDKMDGKWEKTKIIPLDLTPEMKIPQLRLVFESLSPHLENCKTFLAGDVKGVPYAMLEGLGFNIWRSTGFVIDQLDYIVEKEEAAILAAKAAKPEPAIVGDIRDGFYRFDLADALNSDPDTTSKQLLLPFLEKTTFQRLELICEHPPRWFNSEFPRLKLRYEVCTPQEVCAGCNKGCNPEVTVIVTPQDWR